MADTTVTGRKQPLDDEDLIDIVTRAAGEAIGPHEGDLERDSVKANNYYLGKLYGDEVEGRSEFVSREVFETVEWIMPYLVDVFFSGDQAAVFEPEDDDDVQSAEQETEYVNAVFYRQNKGFKIGYTWLKDGLLNKLAVVKAVREGCFGVRVESADNLTEDQVALRIAELDPETLISSEVTQQKDNLFSLDLKFQESGNKTVIYNVPPESFRVSDTRDCISTAYYTGEFYKKSISELREMGYDVPDDISDESGVTDLSTLTDHRVSEVQSTLLDGRTDLRGSNPAAREVEVAEEYTFIDIDQDGFTELVKTVRVGKTLLDKSVVQARPYHAWSSIMVPHRLHGLSAADAVMDLQKLRSRLIRNMLDNQWRQNNGRYAVVDGEVNLDDLLVSTPHGIVRENFSGAVRALDTPTLGPDAFNMLGYTDTLMERRSGVSERSTGLDPRQFNSNTAATTAELVMTAAQQKIHLIARIFAEIGLKELFLGIHRLGLQFEHPGMKIRNNDGKFIALNPNAWRDRADMTIRVGTGNASKTQTALSMDRVMASQQAIIAGGGLGTLVTPTNVYNLAIDHAKALGRKDAARYFKQPESDEIPDSGPSENDIKLEEMRLEAQETQAKLEIEAQKLEIEAAKQILAEEKLELEKQRLEFEVRRHEDENEFKLLEAQIELEQGGPTKLGND